MPRTKRQITSDAHAAGRVVDGADRPLRFEEIRSGLHAAGIDLTVKQARRTLELAERLCLVGRVNRSRWGRVDEVQPPAAVRRSRAETVTEVAARLLELPASTELNRAVRAVLRLATEEGARPVLSRQAPRIPAPAAAPDAPTPLANQERKANGAHDRTGQVEVLVDAHS